MIDADLGVVLQPKPLTELDRLSHVYHQMSSIFVHPKGYMKFVPAGKCIQNEAFRGLSKSDCMNLENWQFSRDPKDEEIQGMIAREEATYCADVFDCVANEMPKKSWSL